MSEWKLVPVEPTEEMVEAGFDAVPGAHEGFIRARWRCMLAAAPQPPSQWPAPRPMSEAPKDRPVLAWWPESKEWAGVRWWDVHAVWLHSLSKCEEQQPTHWLPMPPDPPEQEVTK